MGLGEQTEVCIQNLGQPVSRQCCQEIFLILWHVVKIKFLPSSITVTYDFYSWVHPYRVYCVLVLCIDIPQN